MTDITSFSRIVLLAPVVVSLVLGQQVLQEKRGKHFLVRDVFVDAERFSFTNVERLSQAALDEYNDLGFVQFTAFGGERPGRPAPKPDHWDYSQWHRSYVHIATRPTRVAEMIAIQGDAVLRYRGVNGEVLRRVLRGRDPLIGPDFEVLHITLNEAPLRRGEQKTRASVFARTQLPLEAGLGERIFVFLRQRLGLPLSLYARNDVWFIDNWRFPVLYPFSPAVAPPSAEEHRRSRTLHCSMESGELACSLAGGE